MKFAINCCSPNTTGPHVKASAYGGYRKGFLSSSSKQPGMHLHVPPSCRALSPVTANSSTYCPSATSLQRQPLGENLLLAHASVRFVTLHSWDSRPDFSPRALNWKSTRFENVSQVELEYLDALTKQLRTWVMPSVQVAGQAIRASVSVCAVHTGSAGIIYGVYLVGWGERERELWRYSTVIKNKKIKIITIIHTH